jgi:hypothetical protein
MSFREYLTLVIFAGLCYTAVFLFFKIFLGHYGVVLQAVSAVLLVLTPFIPQHWYIFVLRQAHWLIGEAIRILESESPASS